VQPDRFQTPFAFIFLYDRQSFLAFRQQEVMLWNLNGERISHFQDHSLWFPAAAEDHTSVIFITENQDVVRPQRGRGGIAVRGLAGECGPPFFHTSVTVPHAIASISSHTPRTVLPFLPTRPPPAWHMPAPARPHRRPYAQIISLCESRRASDRPRDQRSKIAIHVSHIASGECLARVDWHAHNRSTVTALSYNDTRGDLVVGDEHGRIHVWSN